MRRTRTPLAVLAVAAMTAVSLAACSAEDSGGGDAYTELIGSGPVADDATVEANEWASGVREAGVLEVGGTETSELFSLLDPTSGEARGFDAAISQLLSRYILGEVSTDLQQVTVDTRESLLEQNTVDTVIATYSITPERAERIAFAGPYYSSQAGILVTKDNEEITSIADLAGKKVATQANSTGVTLLEEEAPEAEIVALPDHAQALAAVQQGNADAYVIDETLLLNAVVAEDDVKLVGEAFGPRDLYGIGVNSDSDAVDFINEFLTQITDDGTWAKVWQLTIGDRTGLDTPPAPPTPGDTGL
ncbi:MULTISPECIES: transporter substrate-binding domain-containing protein [unclassified Pseudactinotalea]|uniref:transporter substrate-binding domain-containing protein n=1 Tax=unclassified Pseudactinotalea TaxID=2649176 RepID=UPI00128AE6D1|nr:MULTISPECIES: transporter substrate-binding domain-containing protein [unclassified Pseudactinotalea]MPV48626.1 transporter substrate-binding domain-containing protein [Pseudactinotalea sp. HY160]QGH68601.1 transporter substrate-binding domain-containing protein [Pseudactinotalea sp. HY158]